MPFNTNDQMSYPANFTVIFPSDVHHLLYPSERIQLGKEFRLAVGTALSIMKSCTESMFCRSN